VTRLETGAGRIAEAASRISIDRNLPSLGAGACTHTIAAFGSRDIWRIRDASCHTTPCAAAADSRREGSNRRRYIHRRHIRRPRNRTWPEVGSYRLANSGLEAMESGAFLVPGLARGRRSGGHRGEHQG